MPDISMCPEVGCSRRSTCYRYMAIPNGRRQSYMLGRGNLDADCNKYVEVKEDSYLTMDSLSKVDEGNRIILKTWQGKDDEFTGV